MRPGGDRPQGQAGGEHGPLYCSRVGLFTDIRVSLILGFKSRAHLFLRVLACNPLALYPLHLDLAARARLLLHCTWRSKSRQQRN